MRRQTAEVIGTGRLARALAAWLPAAGWRLRPSLGRGKLAGYRPVAPLVFLAVPDDALAPLAARLARHGSWRGRVVLHGSGALPAAVLAPLRRAGAAVAGLHPLMTLTGDAVPSPAGLVFALEGDRAACRLARRVIAALGAAALPLRAAQKARYHLAATFASPLVVVAFALALEQLRRARLAPGARRRAASGLQKLLAQTAANLAPGDATALAAAWTGPLARGDARTVARHRAVAGPAAPAYAALAAAARRLLPPTRFKGSALGPRSRVRNLRGRPAAADGS